MARKSESGIEGDRDGRGADRHVNGGNADDIDQQRDSEDRAAAADHAENSANHGSRQDCQ